MKDKLMLILAGMKRPHMERRVPALLVSVVLMGIGVAVFDMIGFGADPCTVMCMGLSMRLGIPFGTVQLLLNALLMIYVFWFDAGRIGLGTLANMTIVGYVAQFFMYLIDQVPALAALSMAARIIIFVPTLTLFLIAASTYMCVNMGVAAYDATPQVVAQRRNWTFRTVRMCWDFVMMAGGFLLGAVAGPVTIGITLFMGPLVTWMSGYVRRFFD